MTKAVIKTEKLRYPSGMCMFHIFLFKVTVTLLLKKVLLIIKHSVNCADIKWIKAEKRLNLIFINRLSYWKVITIDSFAITASDVFAFEFLILSRLHFLAS